MNKEKIIIKVTNNINKFIDRCIRRKIDLLNIRYLNKNNCLIKIYKSDLENIKKYNYYSEIKVYKVLGIERLFLILKKNLLYFITIILCFILMNLLENIIFDIKVIHSNKEIIELVNKNLKENGIKVFSLAKDFDEIERIRLKIIDDNPDTIEWLSITKKGMKYIIRVEERIITNIEKEDTYCHIIAKKSGIVKKIVSTKGEIVPAINDYVRDGDILISGQIHLYEEVKDNVCANGSVYAEVWYKVNVSIPLNYQEKTYTGNKRYNLIINNKKLFKNKYSFYDEEEIYSLNKFNLKYYQELEYSYIEKKYTKEEALNKALEEVEIKMKTKLKDNGEVTLKKVLKNSEFNSRIDVEVFVVTLEDIAMKQLYEMSDESDSNTE